MKKILLFVYIITTLLVAGNFEADYKKALSLSLEFYDAQGAGARGESWRRVSWRNPSTLNDGSDVGVDLSGGWFDAGDHVKFGLPMSYSTTMLNWGYLTYRDGYKLAGEEEYFRNNIKFVLDYFLKAYNDKGTETIEDDVFYYQVGNAGADHGFWGPPELMKMERPTYSCDKDKKCTEVTAGTAAALASGYLVFKDINKNYANTLLEKAKKLYSFAETYQGNNGYTAANGFYQSFSGYFDELAWGAIWLYQATNDKSYLEKAKTYVVKSGNAIYWAQSWDNVSNGVYLLLTKFGETQFKSKIEEHLNYWLNGITYTSGGLAHLSEWGSLRYSSTTAFLAFLYSDIVEDITKKLAYREFATKQINYILGDNPLHFSYEIGYGNKFPINPHHRAAHYSTTNNIDVPKNNTYTLNGALVGGPKSPDDYDYKDDRRDYVRNEVATDYNAGFTGALAKLVILNPNGKVLENNTTETNTEDNTTSTENNTTETTTESNTTSTETNKTTEDNSIGLLTLFRQKIKEWEGGYCEEVAIQNTTSQPQTWEIDLKVDKDIYTFKDADIKKINGKWIAKGVSYNQVVQPNGRVSFSFCAGVKPTEDNTTTTEEINTIEEPETQNQDGLEIVRSKMSDWEKGFCETIKIYNRTQTPKEWNISLKVEGTIYNLWNANYTQEGVNLKASGVNWNKRIEPSKYAEFGFCANKTIETLIQKEKIEKEIVKITQNSTTQNSNGLEVKEVKQNDWGSGYCEDVIIKNSSNSDKVWEVTIPFEGTIYNIWNTNYRVENSKLIAKGVDFNKIVKANSQVSFGFCSNR